MAKVLSISQKFAAPQKAIQSRKRGFILLKSRHADEAQSVGITPKKDEHQTNRGIRVRAIELFYL